MALTETLEEFALAEMPRGAAAPSRPTRQFSQRVRIAGSIAALRAMRDEWEALTAAAHEYSLASSYAYAELAASLVFANGGVVAVATVHDGRDLHAIWPFAIGREGMLRVARELTCGSNEEYGGPLIRGDAYPALLAAALAAAQRIRADVLEIRWLPHESRLRRALAAGVPARRLTGAPKKSHPQPGYAIRMRDHPRWEDFAATLPHTLRANLQRQHKRLGAKGRIEFGWCATAADSEAVLRWLYANKRRWAETRGIDTSWLMDDQVRDFFIALAHRLDLSETPLVAFAKLNDVPVAAAVMLVGPRAVEGLTTTYDETFRSYSVGGLLQEFLAKWTHAQGRDFDLRYLYSPYKAQWSNDETAYRKYAVFLTRRGRLVRESAALAAALGRRGEKIAEQLSRRFRAAAPPAANAAEARSASLSRYRAWSFSSRSNAPSSLRNSETSFSR